MNGETWVVANSIILAVAAVIAICDLLWRQK